MTETASTPFELPENGQSVSGDNDVYWEGSNRDGGSWWFIHNAKIGHSALWSIVHNGASGQWYIVKDYGSTEWSHILQCKIIQLCDDPREAFTRYRLAYAAGVIPNA